MDEENNSGLRQVIEKELDSIPVLLTPKGLHLEDYFTDMSWNDFSTLIESLADEAKVKVLGFCMDFIGDKQYTFVRFKGYSEVERFITYVNAQGFLFKAETYEGLEPLGLSKLTLIKKLK